MDRRSAQTRIGTIGSAAAPVIDGRGRVTADGAGGAWLLDWWVGADDRWHLVVDEPTVRQGLLGHAPVMETRLRVPGGDAVHRAYGVRGTGPRGGQEYVVVEVENDSPVPFALALVVRPALSAEEEIAAVGVARIDTEPVAGGSGRDQAHLVRVDGRAALILPRAPARAAVASGSDAELATVVTTGRAGPWPAPPALDPDRRRAAMAFVLPVTHRTTLRVLLPIGTEIDPTWPSALPSLGQVVKGWTAQAERGGGVDLPDPKLMAVLAAARRRVLLYGPGADLLSTYDRLGHHGQVAEELKARAAAPVPEQAGAVHLLDGLVTHWRLTRDRSVLEATAGTLADAVSRVATSARRRRRREVPAGRRAMPDATCRSVAGAVELFGALGDHRAANDTRVLAEQMLSDVRAVGEDQDHRDRPLPAAAAEAGPSGAWGSPDADRAVIALLVADLWRRLADDRRDTQLALLAQGLPASWYGQPVDVQELPTASGTLSYAVRWHGNRPALLWELTPHADCGEVTITAPGLDPAWRSTAIGGEALLARVAAPQSDADHAGQARGDGPLTSTQPPRSVSPLVSSTPTAAVAVHDGYRDAGLEPPGPGASFS